MSDYLTNLAARTLGAQVGVQPRLPSLFAPLPAGNDHFLLPAVSPVFRGLETDEALDAAGEMAFTMMPASPRTARRKSAGSVRGQTAPIHPQTEDEQQSEPQNQRVPARPQHLTPRLFSDATASMPDEHSPAPAPGDPNRKLAPLISQAAPARDSVERGVFREGPRPPEPISPAPRATPTPTVVLPPAIVARPRIKPHIAINGQNSFAKAPALETSKEAPPTIHVSIGRVEVRATATPNRAPQSKTGAAAASALSLEDYLRGRAGEGR